MDTSPDHPAAPPADAGLRCPRCGYNLTGLAEDRCPECGEAFDRELLRMIAEGRPGPIPGWDDVANPVVAFCGTCLRTWFSPSALGRQFPAVHNRHSLVSFKLAAFCVAVGEYLLLYFGVLGKYPYSDAFATIPLIVGAFCGAAVCERWARGVLELCFGHALARDRKLDVWAGLVGLHRSFLLITTAALPVSTSVLPGGTEHTLALPFAAIVAWWAVSLAVAAAGRGHSYWRAAPAILLLLVTAGAAVFVGAVGGFVFTGALWMIGVG